MSAITPRGIRHVLLDIEGTTCPISFVAQTLFPYAASHLPGFLEGHRQAPAIQRLVAELRQLWSDDPDPEAQQLLRQAHASGALGDGGDPADLPTAIVPYVRHLIALDRKLTPLKDLQGMIWAEGYGQGDLIGPLFDDVEPMLRQWRQRGLRLSVYSSGSISAQQLLYQHSNAGDLRPLFHRWYDTRTGAKQAPLSYGRISADLGGKASDILFVSDVCGELDAARQAGLQAVLITRPGNAPLVDGVAHPRISSLREIVLSGLAEPSEESR